MKTACTRPSTVARALEDQSGLFSYVAATTLKTVAEHPDLSTRLALTTGDWRAFKDLYLEADRRGGKREASDGTNIHMVVQALIAGQDVSRVPDPARTDGLAVWEFIQKQGWKVLANELDVVTTGLEEPCAGTLDLLLESESGIRFVGDVKSGAKFDGGKYKATSWGIQTAIYASGRPYIGGTWERDQWGRPLVDLEEEVGEWKVNTDSTRAVVLEIIRGTGQVRAVWLNLMEGWANAERCMEIRRVRKKGLTLTERPDWA